MTSITTVSSTLKSADQRCLTRAPVTRRHSSVNTIEKMIWLVKTTARRKLLRGTRRGGGGERSLRSFFHSIREKFKQGSSVF
ncbi:hypothetical protein TNCV_2947221 [Trichonephila clavipes]|nr:hypothetical protein TNCV_2947221 [Trichonephila clavipes]